MFGRRYRTRGLILPSGCLAVYKFEKESWKLPLRMYRYVTWSIWICARRTQPMTLPRSDVFHKFGYPISALEFDGRHFHFYRRFDNDKFTYDKFSKCTHLRPGVTVTVATTITITKPHSIQRTPSSRDHHSPMKTTTTEPNFPKNRSRILHGWRLAIDCTPRLMYNFKDDDDKVDDCILRGLKWFSFLFLGIIASNDHPADRYYCARNFSHELLQTKNERARLNYNANRVIGSFLKTLPAYVYLVVSSVNMFDLITMKDSNAARAKY